jgi:hypothetical protein
MTHRLTARPISGRVVVRSRATVRAGHTTSHRGWLLAGQIITHCGRSYRPGNTRDRMFVRSIDLVPISCYRCLGTSNRRITMTDTTWPCEAYGEDGLRFGAYCFTGAGTGNAAERTCATPDVCHTRMTAERERLWTRLQIMAEKGDAEDRVIAREVLRGFSGPDDLLRGD